MSPIRTSPDLLLRASKFIAATVKTNVLDEPASDSDWVAHDLACELAVEADRLERTPQDEELKP